MVEPVDETVNRLGTGDALPLVQIQPTYTQNVRTIGVQQKMIFAMSD